MWSWVKLSYFCLGIVCLHPLWLRGDMYLKDIYTEGGSENWLILQMNSIDRLCEMWTRGVQSLINFADVF